MKVGRYRHYKGKDYEVIGIGKHSENLEEFVIYKQLYGEFGLWIRPKQMFEENIILDGKEIPRFEYIGE